MEVLCSGFLQPGPSSSPQRHFTRGGFIPDRLTLDCQILTAENGTERLIVFTAPPDSEDADKLKLLSILGTQTFSG